MEKLLTIEEVAEFLNLEYKSVYRLVRNGELPAARIGRVYRVSRSDLDAYLDQQKQVVQAEARTEQHIAKQDIHCGACGKQIVSKLGIAGHCEICMAALCKECFTLNGITRCRAHQVKDGE